MTRLRTEAAHQSARWHRILEPPPPDDAAELRCPDDDLAQQANDAVERVVLVEAQYLTWFFNGTTPTVHDDSRWNLLTAQDFRRIQPPRSANSKRALVDSLYHLKRLNEANRYAAVLHISQQSAPRMEGERFHPGHLSGWLVVYDLPQTKRLCQTHITIDSSPEVHGSDREDAEALIWKDFHGRIVRGLDDSLRRITRQLNL